MQSNILFYSDPLLNTPLLLHPLYPRLPPSSPLPPPSYPLQVKKTNRRHHNELPQTYGESKYICTVWIRPTENLLTHPKTSYRINEFWSDQCWCTALSLPFRSELTNEWWILWTSNRNRCHDLTKSCGSRKLVCTVWIRRTDNFLQHLMESIRTNERWTDQCQRIIAQHHTNNYKFGDWTQNNILDLMGYWLLRLGPMIANITKFLLIHEIGWKVYRRITHVMPLY